MQDQDSTTPQPTTQDTTKVVDVVTQPSTPVPAPDPEQLGEPSVEQTQVSTQVPVEQNASEPEQQAKPRAETSAVDVAHPAQSKQPSTTPIGPIIVAVIIFIALAVVALVAFQQGL